MRNSLIIIFFNLKNNLNELMFKINKMHLNLIKNIKSFMKTSKYLKKLNLLT